MVTLLFGIALNRASVFTDVLALGFVDWPAAVLVLLPAWLVVDCASVAPLVTAKTAAAMIVSFLVIIPKSPW
jgi:hypothetical protein